MRHFLCEGYHVRISGQDVERGTFNQRHAVMYDQDLTQCTNGDEKIYKPWTNLQSMFSSCDEPPNAMTPEELLRSKQGDKESPRLGVAEICNSPLSEEGVLAFEHGYSIYSASNISNDMGSSVW